MTYLLDSQQKVWILFKFGFRRVWGETCVSTFAAAAYFFSM